jgi:hypothetical protein
MVNEQLKNKQPFGDNGFFLAPSVTMHVVEALDKSGTWDAANSEFLRVLA